MKSKEELYKKLEEGAFYNINLYSLMEMILTTDLLTNMTKEKINNIRVNIYKKNKTQDNDLSHVYSFVNKTTEEELSIRIRQSEKALTPSYEIITKFSDEANVDINIKKTLEVIDCCFCTTKISIYLKKDKSYLSVFEYYHSQHFSRRENDFEITAKDKDEFYHEVALEILQNKMIPKNFDFFRDLLLLKTDSFLDLDTYSFLKDNFGEQTLIQKATDMIESLKKEQPTLTSKEIMKVTERRNMNK